MTIYYLNELKAKILLMLENLEPHLCFSRYIALKLRLSYEYVNKAIKEMEYMGYIRYVRRGSKKFIVVKNAELYDIARQILNKQKRGKHAKD